MKDWQKLRGLQVLPTGLSRGTNEQQALKANVSTLKCNCCWQRICASLLKQPVLFNQPVSYSASDARCSSQPKLRVDTSCIDLEQSIVALDLMNDSPFSALYNDTVCIDELPTLQFNLKIISTL